MTPIGAWHEEHAHFLKLLAQLQEQLDVFHGAERPDYELMLEVIQRLRELGDRQHHPREEAAFERLAQRQPDMALQLARLRQEHRVIAHAGDILAGHLDAILGGAVVPRALVETAAATYLVYYGNHIAKEEADILPRAGAALTPEDWRAVAAAA
ncbi:MAG TPA: hemerythrin domain-containing protein [Burkholderiales bacterium]